MKSLTVLGPVLLALTSVNAAPKNPVAEATVATVTVRAPTPTTDLSARQETIVCDLVYFPITSPGAAPGADCGGYNGDQCNFFCGLLSDNIGKCQYGGYCSGSQCQCGLLAS